MNLIRIFELHEAITKHGKDIDRSYAEMKKLSKEFDKICEEYFNNSV